MSYQDHTSIRQVLLCLIAAAAVSHCRSKIDAHQSTRGPSAAASDTATATDTATSAASTTDTDTASEPATVDVKTLSPKPIADAFRTSRLFYQSRSVISLGIGGASQGAAIELINVTSGYTLISRQPLALGLTDDPAPAFALASGFDIELKLYPSDATMVGRFKYGDNALRLKIEEGGETSEATAVLRLADFPLQGLGTTSFSEDVQIRGGFQGWLNATTVPVASAPGGTTLTSGLFNIVND